VGIPEEDLPYIFEDFFRGKPGPADERGYGLGLALSKRIIEIHYGSLSVDSEPGKGSIFVIRLPADSHAQQTQPPNYKDVLPSPV
jgi:signal transduction histidine kinase